MYKKTSDSESFRTKTGSFSTRISSRGYADVPPPGIIDIEFEMVSLAEKVRMLRDTLASIRRVIAEGKGDHVAMKNSLGAVEGELGSLRKDLLVKKKEYRGTIFHAIACSLLPVDVVKFLERETSGVIASQGPDVEEAYKTRAGASWGQRRARKSCGNLECDEEKEKLRKQVDELVEQKRKIRGRGKRRRYKDRVR